MAVQAKRFEYAVGIDRAGRMSAEGGALLEPARAWTADHLLLAALARCSIESLRYHAGNAGIDLVAAATAEGAVTRRESDGRYAFVEIRCSIEVELEPEPDDLAALLARAERDCFVGASLTVKPEYRWRVVGAGAG